MTNSVLLFTIVFLEACIIGLLLVVLIKGNCRSNAIEGFSHLRYVRDRSVFNKIGVEITNGTISGDTIYLVLRSGTVEAEFSDALKRFRSHPGTKLIMIVPDQKIFFSNCSDDVAALISQTYENRDCEGVRAMLLEPGEDSLYSGRMSGYFYLSDGHNHQDDEGFYALSDYSHKFLQKYLKMLITNGEEAR